MLLMCVYVCVYASNSVNQEQCEKYQELFIHLLPYNWINHLQKDYFVSGFSYLHICTPQLILIRWMSLKNTLLLLRIGKPNVRLFVFFSENLILFFQIVFIVFFVENCHIFFPMKSILKSQFQKSCSSTKTWNKAFDVKQNTLSYLPVIKELKVRRAIK